jgi:hypothetical protein
MPDYNTAEIDTLHRVIVDLQAQQRSLRLDFTPQITELQRRLEAAVALSQSGSGTAATLGSVAAGAQGVAVGGHVLGDIYHGISPHREFLSVLFSPLIFASDQTPAAVPLR